MSQASSYEREHKRESLKEEHHVEKVHEEKPSGLLGKIQQVGKAGLEKVEQIYEDIVGGGSKVEKHEHIKVDVPVERKEAEILRESELYRSVLKENEEDLIKSAEKIEASRSDLSDELAKVRGFASQAEETFRAGAEQLKQAEMQMRQEADLVGGIMRDNEQILGDMSQKLETSAKRLRHEVNRIKAEELKRAADELKFRAERLEQYAEETSTVAESLEQRGEEQRGEIRRHEETKEGQYPAGSSAEAIRAHRHEGISHQYYKEGYPGQVPPTEYEHETKYATPEAEPSSKQLAKEPKQTYEQEKIQQKERMF